MNICPNHCICCQATLNPVAKFCWMCKDSWWCHDNYCFAPLFSRGLFNYFPKLLPIVNTLSLHILKPHFLHRVNDMIIAISGSNPNNGEYKSSQFLKFSFPYPYFGTVSLYTCRWHYGNCEWFHTRYPLPYDSIHTVGPYYVRRTSTVTTRHQLYNSPSYTKTCLVKSCLVSGMLTMMRRGELMGWIE